jgi:hypothetical protein
MSLRSLAANGPPLETIFLNFYFPQRIVVNVTDVWYKKLDQLLTAPIMAAFTMLRINMIWSEVCSDQFKLNEAVDVGERVHGGTRADFQLVFPELKSLDKLEVKIFEVKKSGQRRK